jgi:hypothetical protein
MANENAASQLGLAFAMFSLRCCNCGVVRAWDQKGLGRIRGHGRE